MKREAEIAILDFGSQYTHLIARRVRELGVRSHIYRNDVSKDELSNAVGIILSGGPRSLVKDPRLPIDEGIFDLGLPILGLCYGHQLMADHFGGSVSSGEAREYGVAMLEVSPSPIFARVNSSTVWMSHGDHVAQLPDGFVQIATTGNDSIAAMANEEKRMYGFQFHPEVNHSEQGMTMLSNFVFDICTAEKNWTTDTMLEELQEQIRKEAGDKNVFLLISGGVDSTVCFALLEKTLGKERVYGLHVDHGFMRKDESALVANALKEIGLDDLHIYDAEQEYLDALAGVSEPEKKRNIIGELFLDITERVMKEQNLDDEHWLLGQGTIYPDTIESGGTENADKIKTHHNRVDRVQDMIAKGLVIEPIKELYKDEVREIGLKLGLPEALIHRHPFPGPGLAIRCLCAETDNHTAEHIDTDLWKLPVQSVGVQGDERSYSHPALVTAAADWDNLRTLSPTLTNTHKDINRVLQLVHGDASKLSSSSVPTAHLTKERTELLRSVDAIVNKHIVNPSCENIWQFPVVLVPFGYDKKESIVLRPVESKEAMTVSFAQLPQDILDAIVEDIKNLGAIDYIFYDVTNKPPGTIEWE